MSSTLVLVVLVMMVVIAAIALLLLYLRNRQGTTSKVTTTPVGSTAADQGKQTGKQTGKPTGKPTGAVQQGAKQVGAGAGPNPDGSWPALPPLDTITLDKTRTYRVRATYYGPDKLHGIHGGNDNIFEHIPSGQYTASQLRQIGKHFCAMSEKFLKKGFMGKILKITGAKASADFVVVDLLPDRNDGKGVEVDIHDMNDWLMLGGDEAIGIQEVKIQVVGTASIPVPSNSAWDPKKFGFS